MCVFSLTHTVAKSKFLSKKSIFMESFSMLNFDGKNGPNFLNKMLRFATVCSRTNFFKGTKWLKRDVKAFHTIFSNLCVYFFHSIGWVWLSVLAGFRRSFASWNQAHGLSLRHCNYVVYQLHFDDSLRANVGFNWDPWSLMDLRGHFIPWLHFHCHWFTRN